MSRRSADASRSGAGYRYDPGWRLRLSPGPEEEFPDASAGDDGRLYVLGRNPGAVHVARLSDGVIVRTFGIGVISARPHGVTVGEDSLIYVADAPDHVVRVFDRDGNEIRTLGRPGIPSDTGADDMVTPNDRWRTVLRSAGPFNRPAKAYAAADGTLLVADGYANARVHRFDGDGRLLASWGEPGTGPGEFHNVHSVLADAAGRVLAADREGDRIQVFDADGVLLETWDAVSRATCLARTPGEDLLVTELGRRRGETTPRRGAIPVEEPAGIARLGADGHLLGFSTAFLDGPAFVTPHSITVAPDGSAYVSDLGLGRILRGVPIPPST